VQKREEIAEGCTDISVNHSKYVSSVLHILAIDRIRTNY